MENKASYGRKLGNTFPVTLYIRTAVLEGNLEDHDVSVSLTNETKGVEVPVPCVVEDNTVKFSFTKDLQYRAGGVGFYTPRIVVDAGDANVGDADWYRGIEIVKHSSQEYSNRSAGMNVGPVVLEGDMSLIANGLSAYEMWLADGHEGTLSQFIAYLRQPAVDEAEACAAAEALRVAAENTRAASEATRVEDEAARASAEALRASAESARAAAETLRAQAEQARAAAEAAREAAEALRVSAENTRNSSESTRLANEANRVSAEASRAASESDRVAKELLRASAEALRASAETNRDSAESARIAAESARATAEASRVSAENARVTAEAARVTAEAARVTAENSRASAESTRQSNEQTRQNQEAARESASQQAVSAANTAAAAAQAVVADAAAIREAAAAATEAAAAANAAAQALSGAVADVAALREDVDELMLGSHDHMAAAWADGQTSPAAAKTAGDPSLINYHMFVIDHTRNQETVSHPLGKLKMNNYLRYDDGSFAPTVGITQAMYDECMTHDLYMDGELYCASGAFDPVAFFELCTVVTGQDNVKRISCPVLLKDAADGTEVSHYLMPWETTSVNLSLMLGCEHPLYMLQNVKGTSGRVWNFLSTVRKSWDGHESVELKPTAFSPCPVGMVVDGDSKRHLRTMFCLYDGPSAGNCAGAAGDGNNITMFKQKGRMMPAANVISQVTNMQYARNDNVDNEGPTPFAEGGWHALNTFIAYLEIKYGTRALHAASRFGSGISSNDSCSSEETWRANGGVRCRKVGADTWTYQTLGAKPSVIRKNATGTQWSDWSTAINNYYPKEAVMESQMAASFAVEMGIEAGESFEFYGNVYTWGNAGTADGLGEGRMNSIIRSIRKQNVEAYDAEGNAATFEVEVCLRMSLFEGANLSGDVFMYWGGGMEIIGVCGADTGNGTFGHRIDAWFEPDQEKWLEETDISHNDGSDFDCEAEYTHLGGVVTANNGYSLKDLEMAPFATQLGGSVSQGMCHYNYLGKYWASTQGAKARVGVRFRGFAHASSCSPRYLTATNGAGTTNQDYCGSAQVALPESATTTQS